MMEHNPVLTKEVLIYLNPKPNENFVDATLGLGGHAAEILALTAPSGRLLGIDQDPFALEEAEKRLVRFKDRLDLVKENFSELGLLIRQWEVEKVDGVLLDLGASTYQLQSAERGFSFMQDGPLDMRMDPANKLTAERIINNYSEKEIAKILFEFGEEQFARQIAKKIVDKRVKKEIKTTLELVELIRQAMPPHYRFKQKINFATKTFMALRIAVNDELEQLKRGLIQALQILSPGGRLVVISFHSLEDRIVKNFFRDNNLTILTPKPIVASDEELLSNPNARSAKLRAAQK